jgi:predicted O-linked N-acetylglucosamine transferase (SPINDLY family)/glycosyltransferase involved in cell wall biosynthesis
MDFSEGRVPGERREGRSPGTFELALQHHRAGRPAEAERLCRQILARDPHHGDSLHLLGLIAHQAGQHAAAADLIGRAILRDERVPAYHNSLGLALRAQGKLDEAAACYERAIVLAPSHAGAHGNLGNVLQVQGRSDEAAARYERVLALDPASVTAHNNLGNVLQVQGRLDEAVAHYEQAIALDPASAGAHNNLGSVLHVQGRLDEAVAHYEQAIALDPDFAAAHNNLGNALHAQDRLDGAIASYERVLALRPGSAEALGQLYQTLRSACDWSRLDALETRLLAAPLGRSDRDDQSMDLGEGRAPGERREGRSPGTFELAFQHHRAGRLAEAERLCRQILAGDPHHGDTLHLLGLIAHQTGLHAAAADLIGRAILRDERVPAYHNNLGLVFQAQGKLDEAAACCERALALDPGCADAHNNLGNVLHDQGRLDEAVAHHEQAIALLPGYAGAHNNLGTTLQAQGRLDEAMAHYEQAIALDPAFAGARNNLGSVLQVQGRLDEAVACYERAIALDPRCADAHLNLGNTLDVQGRLDGAIASYERVLALRPGSAETLSHLHRTLRSACEWSRLDELETRLLAAPFGRSDRIPPFVMLQVVGATPADHLRGARAWAAIWELAPHLRFHHRPGRVRDRVRVGYLSSDFHDHATAYLMAEVFERHDRSRFEVFAYSLGPDDGGAMRRRLVQAFDHFVDLQRSSHDEAARRIHDDGIDLLVDLKGYTYANRPQILARRPAPIQINYLGYPGTMGAAFIDYIVADRVVVPDEHRQFYSEEVVHLPACYQPNDTRRRIAEPAPTRAACGLPERGFVFCCFNNSYKITPTFFDVWTRLLQAVPDSVLWLLRANPSVEDNLRREAVARGVDPARLVFAPWLPYAEHLARHRLADLFLDTLPYNAHTGGSDALWAGLPVLTCVGETFAGRVGKSLLHAVGLPELVTSSLAEYEALALELATRTERLAALQERLARNRTTAPLFDAGRFTRGLEAAYLHMWETWQSGRAPAAFAVEPGPSRIGGGERKLDVLVWTGPAWERWGPESLRTGGIGGSETAAILLGRELARRGHRVTALGEHQGLEGSHDGVRYVHYQRGVERPRDFPADVLVCSRQPSMLDIPFPRRASFVWAHDTSVGPSDRRLAEQLSRVDRIFCLSEWHKRLFLAQYPFLDPGAVLVTRNGLDLSRFQRDPVKLGNRLVYSSSPDRGLERLLELMPSIRYHVPDVELHVYYGFVTWKKIAEARGDREDLERIRRIEALLETHEARGLVTYHGRVDQTELADAFLAAKVWAYPTWFTETYCISAAEAQAAGCVPVTTALAALPETVSHGLLLEPPCTTPDYARAFVGNVVRLLRDETERLRLATAGREHALENHGWDRVAESWEGHFHDVLRQRAAAT